MPRSLAFSRPAPPVWRFAVSGRRLEQLTRLRQSNGRPLVVLYGTPTTETRGGTITFNGVDAGGRLIEHLSTAPDC